MSKIDKIFSLLENAPNDVLEELAGTKESVPEAQKKRMLEAAEKKYAEKKYAEKKSAAQHVSEPERYHTIKLTDAPARRKWVSAVCALAASAVVISAAAFGIGHARPVPLSSVSEETQDSAPPTSGGAASAAAQSDEEATLESVCYKMLDSVDNYDWASGNMISCGLLNGSECTIGYCVDMTEGISYQYYHNETDGVTEKTYVSGGQANVYALDGGAVKLVDSYPAVSKKDIFRFDDDERVGVNEDGIPEYQYMQDPTNIHYASTLSLFAQEIAFSILSDTGEWRLTGEETYLDRECFAIGGITGGNTRTEMLVDKETGIVLKLMTYDENGVLGAYMITKSFSMGKPNITIPEDISQVSFNGSGYIGSTREIAGTWYSESSLWHDMLMIDGGKRFVFVTRGGAATTGYIEVDEYDDETGSTSAYYTFYTDDGVLWNSFIKYGDMSGKDLETGNTADTCFRREQRVTELYEEAGEMSPYLSLLVGTYKSYEGYGKIKTIVISPNGTFAAFSGGLFDAYGVDAAQTGRLELTSEENDDGTEALVCTLKFDETDREFMELSVNDINDLSGLISARYGFYKEVAGDG